MRKIPLRKMTMKPLPRQKVCRSPDVLARTFASRGRNGFLFICSMLFLSNICSYVLLTTPQNLLNRRLSSLAPNPTGPFSLLIHAWPNPPYISFSVRCVRSFKRALHLCKWSDEGGKCDQRKKDGGQYLYYVDKERIKVMD